MKRVLPFAAGMLLAATSAMASDGVVTTPVTNPAMNIWNQIETVRTERRHELAEACSLLKTWSERPMTRAALLRLANLIALGNTTHDAALREYRYCLARAFARGWSGHLIGI
jgi:archaellum biogenesis protein FlaJ (TadC family)